MLGLFLFLFVNILPAGIKGQDKKFIHQFLSRGHLCCLNDLMNVGSKIWLSFQPVIKCHHLKRFELTEWLHFMPKSC